ncbi:MAG: cupin domain-containing protein [Desulfatibacillaceae bacterium]
MGDIKVRKNVSEVELDEKGVRDWPVWEKECSEFPWRYDDEETCYFLEGEVEVTCGESKETFTMGKGDLVTFPKGLSCTWKIKKDVRKHYTFK